MSQEMHESALWSISVYSHS